MQIEYERFQLGAWTVDPVHSAITQKDKQIKIERRLVRLLSVLAREPRRGLSKDELMGQVWSGRVVSDDALAVAISSLRKALGCNARRPVYIETIPGYGFRLLAPVKWLDEKPRGRGESSAAGQVRVGRVLKSGSILMILATLTLLGLSTFKPVEQATELVQNEVFAKTRYLIRQGGEAQLGQARVLLSGLKEQYPENPQLWYEEGLIALSQHSPKSAPDITHAKVCFKQALQRAPDHADAYYQLAIIAFLHEFKLPLAREYFLQSIAHKPHAIKTHLSYAGLLLATREYDQALHHNKIAGALDPDYYASAMIEWIYNLSGQYEKAEKELGKLYSINPDSKLYRKAAIRLYENMGEETKAFKLYQLAFKAAGYGMPEMQAAEQAFKEGGLKALNHWLANIKQEQQDIGQYEPPLATARYYAAAGEIDRAMDHLEMALAKNDYRLMWINVDPKYNVLRVSPRFQSLLRRLGLQQPKQIQASL